MNPVRVPNGTPPPNGNLTNAEKVALRVRDLLRRPPHAHVVLIRIIFGHDGEPVAWTVQEEGAAEGLTRG